MKFYEVHEPYYALLKSENAYDALDAYVEDVAGSPEEKEQIKAWEVKRDYALAKFSRAKSEDGKMLPVTRLIQEFNNENNKMLLLDGALL